ncbi:hypothetical protein [Thomasclavelia cocleata]|uniref:hypothetical protein n=1 Tax=Thomasclavelia cocleata TaxID=69824 RepID=UPI0025772E6C|nr:hypothetical protein [Thomasclavelia cocleata]
MKKIILICLFCFLILGCKQKAPDCTASETQELVINIVKEQAMEVFIGERRLREMGMSPEKIEEHKTSTINLYKERGLDINQITFNLEAIRTIKVEDNGNCLCKANLIMKGYMPNNSGEKSIPIRYTSELTDNEDEFLVTVYDF